MKREGREPMFAKPMKRYNLTLDEATVRQAKELGRKNISAGLRAAVDMARDYISQNKKS